MPPAEQRDALVGRLALVLSIAAVTVLAATIAALALPSVWERIRAQPPAVAYVEGETIDVDPLAFRASARTVFLFSRFSCGACQASKPVMAGIVADLAERRDVRVILVTGEALPEEEQLFARDLGLAPSRVLQTDLSRLRVRQVPTMVVADAAGRILIAREGLLTESDRIDVVRASGVLPVTQP
jgi:hypothetical protein